MTMMAVRSPPHDRTSPYGFGKIAEIFSQGLHNNMANKIPAGIIAFVISLLTLGMTFPLFKVLDSANLLGISFWIFTILGLALIFLSHGRKPALDAWLGGIAGILIWSGIGEIGDLDELYTHHGVLGLMVILTLYFILRPGTRCDFHLAIQKFLKIDHPNLDDHHWYAPHVALAVVWMIWLGHTIEKIALYGLGTRSWLVWVLLIGSLVSAPFLLYKMWKTKDWGTAWAGSLPAVVIIWVAVDILRRWI